MSGQKKAPSFAYVNNARTPYLRAILEAWAKLLPGPLTVYYTGASDEARYWTNRVASGVEEKDLAVLVPMPRAGNLNRGLFQLLFRHDVIMLAGFEQASHFVLALGARLLGKSVILTLDGFVPRRMGRERSHVYYVKYGMTRLAHGFLANGLVGRRYLQDQFAIPPRQIFDFFLCPLLEPIERLRCGGNEARAAFRHRLGLPNDRRVALFSGRLIGLKRADLLLDAVYSLPPDLRPIILIVGDGPLLGELKAQSCRLGLDTVFTGFLEDEALARCYIAADFLVHPSEGDSWGLVIHEAMAAGRPAIVSDAVGFALDIIDGETGFVFPASDAMALAGAIRKLLALDIECLGENARRMVTDWTPEASARSLRRCVESILSRH